MIPLLLAMSWLGDVRNCACNVTVPATLELKECSLCKVAESQPESTAVFFVKDANPAKPNRLLALPRKHYPAGHSLAQMSAAERTELWTAAIAKSKELWGDDWGVAYNGEERRTQCHGHLHIGKVSPDSQTDKFVVVAGPSDIPAPANGEGMWVHAVSGKLYVHAGEQVTEFNLMR